MKNRKIIVIASMAFTLATCVPVTPLATSSPEWKMYTDEKFLITLKYPASWHFSGYDGYSGKDGFFQISTAFMVTQTAEDWCELEIQHNPDKMGHYQYGTNPSMEVLKVDGQLACLVLPSDDQSQSERGYSLLVVEYPKLADEPTHLLFLNADKDHIHDFIDTLKFER